MAGPTFFWDAPNQQYINEETGQPTPRDQLSGLDVAGARPDAAMQGYSAIPGLAAGSGDPSQTWAGAVKGVDEVWRAPTDYLNQLSNNDGGDFINRFLKGPGAVLLPMLAFGGMMGAASGFGGGAASSGLNLAEWGAGEAGMSAAGFGSGAGAGGAGSLLDLAEWGAGEAGMSGPGSMLDPWFTEPGFHAPITGPGETPFDLLKELAKRFSINPNGGGGSGQQGAGGFADILAQIFGGAGGLSGIGNIGAGLYGLSQGSKFDELLGPSRDAAGKLRTMMDNPLTPKTVGDVTQLPGYQQMLRERENTLTRSMAARGLNASGSEKASIAELGGAQYNEFYNRESDRVLKENALAAETRNSEMRNLASLANNGLATAIAGSQLDANSLNRILYGLGRVGP